jgi:cation:H+ antiporter
LVSILHTTIFTLIAGLALLIFGAEVLVRGAARLSSALGVSPLIVGLTVVAYGTSSAELAACLRSTHAGQGGLAVGIVVGSNIFNVLFVLGFSALFIPLSVTKRLIRLDVPIMIAVSVLLYLLALDGVIGRWDGLLLLAGIVGYTLFTVLGARREQSQTWLVSEVPALAEIKQTSRRPPSLVIQILFIVVGLVMLVLGARWFVSGAVSLAEGLGVSETVIGLTIVAVGTSLPEAATSIVAALRGKPEIAVGNIIGSNIANVLLVMGVTGLVAPHGVDVPLSALKFDIPVMIAVAVSCLPVFFIGGRIERWEGGLYLLYYFAFVLYLILEAGHHQALPAFDAVMAFFVLPVSIIAYIVLTARRARHSKAFPQSLT